MKVIPSVLCCGSRSWQSFPVVRQTLYRLMLAVGFFKVLHGGARGADEISGAVAEVLGLDVEVKRAAWRKHGKAAGMIRNTEMLELKPDYVIAFWDGSSRGTLDTIQKAINQYRIPTMIVRV